MTAKLKLLSDGSGEGSHITNFKTEVFHTPGLFIFSFLQPKDMTIHLMHSPAPFYTVGATGPLKGKDIGFVGDRTDFTTPTPVLLQPERPWKWISKQIVTDPHHHPYFFANLNNEGKLFTPPARAVLVPTSAPQLILIPSCLVNFCLLLERTPWELHQYITTTFIGVQHPPFTTEFDLLKNWCLLAVHNNNGDSALVYDLQAAASNKIFHQWVQTRLDSTLGPIQLGPGPSTVPTPPRTQDLTHLAAIAAKFGKGILHVLQPAVAATIATLPLNAIATDGKEYDQFQKAILQGFAHVPTPAALPTIWSLFSQTESLDTHRLHLQEKCMCGHANGESA